MTGELGYWRISAPFPVLAAKRCSRLRQHPGLGCGHTVVGDHVQARTNLEPFRTFPKIFSMLRLLFRNHLSTEMIHFP